MRTERTIARPGNRPDSGVRIDRPTRRRSGIQRGSVWSAVVSLVLRGGCRVQETNDEVGGRRTTAAVVGAEGRPSASLQGNLVSAGPGAWPDGAVRSRGGLPAQRPRIPDEPPPSRRTAGTTGRVAPIYRLLTVQTAAFPRHAPLPRRAAGSAGFRVSSVRSRCRGEAALTGNCRQSGAALGLPEPDPNVRTTLRRTAGSPHRPSDKRVTPDPGIRRRSDRPSPSGVQLHRPVLAAALARHGP